MKYRYETVTHRELLLHILVKIVNTAEAETNDVIIAKAFIEHRDDLDEWTQDEIAEKYYVSQASISRFIRRLGFKNFQDLKLSMIKSQQTVNLIENPEQQSFDQATQGIYTTLSKVTEDFKNLKQSDVEESIHILKEYKTIYFVGSELSMAIIHLLQMKLTAMGKNAYTLYNFPYQSEMMHNIKDDELAVFVSMGQRWYKVFAKDIFKKENKNSRILWTTASDHADQELFSRVFQIGETEDGNIGYHYLMQYILLLYQLL